MKIFADTDPTVNSLNEFFKNYGMWLAIALASLILIALIVLLLIALFKRKRCKNIEINKEEINLDGFIDSLGGKDNIISFINNGSRLSIELRNYDIVDETKLNELGVNSLIKMSNKIVLVIKDGMDSFVNLLKS